MKAMDKRVGEKEKENISKRDSLRVGQGGGRRKKFELYGKKRG